MIGHHEPRQRCNVSAIAHPVTRCADDARLLQIRVAVGAAMAAAGMGSILLQRWVNNSMLAAAGLVLWLSAAATLATALDAGGLSPDDRVRHACVSLTECLKFCGQPAATRVAAVVARVRSGLPSVPALASQTLTAVATCISAVATCIFVVVAGHFLLPLKSPVTPATATPPAPSDVPYLPLPRVHVDPAIHAGSPFGTGRVFFVAPDGTFSELVPGPPLDAGEPAYSTQPAFHGPSRASEACNYAKACAVLYSLRSEDVPLDPKQKERCEKAFKGCKQNLWSRPGESP